MKKYRITKAGLCPQNLPNEFDGFKIAHLSDLHSYVPDITADVKALAPDIIAITGDLINHDRHDFRAVLELLSALCNVAPLYIVSGNHDLRNPFFEDFIRETKAVGANFIDDSFTAYKKDGAEIGIFGIKDPNVFKRAKLDAALARSLADLPEYDGFRLLLLHRADLFPFLPDNSFDLILSGHMHGGQICLPNGRGILSPKSSIIGIKKPFFPDYTAGLYSERGMKMYVSRGLSNPTALPRIFNDTELVALTLKLGGTRHERTV